MGLLDALFGKKEAYPQLEGAGTAAARIAVFRAQLETLADTVPGRLELVPAADTVYVIIDRPPGPFGVAWFEGGREVNFTALRQTHGLSLARVQMLSRKLAAAYARSDGAARFAATIAGRNVVVTLSEELAAEMRQAIDETVS